MSLAIGIIGAGWWATQHHLPAVAADDRATLAGIADPDPIRRGLASQSHPEVPVFVDASQLLADLDLDAAIVATPHATHYTVARMCLEAGLHVLVEKPMTTSGSQAWELVDLARGRGCHLQVGYPLNLTSTSSKLRAMIQEGQLGEIELVAGAFTSSAARLFRGEGVATDGAPERPLASTYADPEVSGGGQGHTQLTHLLQHALWTIGGQVHTVGAHMRFAEQGYPLDIAIGVNFAMSAGTIGTLASTGTVPKGAQRDQEILYVGTRGSARQDMVTGGIAVSIYDGAARSLELPTGEDPYPARAVATDFIGRLCSSPTESDDSGTAAAAWTAATLEAAYRSVRTAHYEQVVGPRDSSV